MGGQGRQAQAAGNLRQSARPTPYLCQGRHRNSDNYPECCNLRDVTYEQLSRNPGCHRRRITKVIYLGVWHRSNNRFGVPGTKVSLSFSH